MRHHHEVLPPILAEAKRPTHLSAQGGHDLLHQVLALNAKVQTQLARYRELMLAAEMTSPNGDATRSIIERLHQTCGHLDIQAKAHMDAARGIALGLRQMERYCEEIAERVAKETP